MYSVTIITGLPEERENSEVSQTNRANLSCALLQWCISAGRLNYPNLQMNELMLDKRKHLQSQMFKRKIMHSKACISLDP